jgi:hypothetical protein
MREASALNAKKTAFERHARQFLARPAKNL